MGAVVSLLNQKGGVGKTSTCHHLSGALAGIGKRILLLDNDPQASLTQGFFGPAATEAASQIPREQQSKAEAPSRFDPASRQIRVRRQRPAEA